MDDRRQWLLAPEGWQQRVQQSTAYGAVNVLSKTSATRSRAHSGPAGLRCTGSPSSQGLAHERSYPMPYWSRTPAYLTCDSSAALGPSAAGLEDAFIASTKSAAEEEQVQSVLLQSLHDANQESTKSASEEEQLQSVLLQSLHDVSQKPAPAKSEPLLPVDVREQLQGTCMPSDLGQLLLKLGQTHPTIVREITWTAGSTLKFQYLQACIHENAMDDKSKSQELWRLLPERDQWDLLGAFELGDGERDRFFLQIAEEDRHMREKLEGQTAVAWADKIGGTTSFGGTAGNVKGPHDSCVDNSSMRSYAHGTAEKGLAGPNFTAPSAAGSSLERFSTGCDGKPRATNLCHSQFKPELHSAQGFDAMHPRQLKQIPLTNRWVQAMRRQNVQPAEMFRALDKDHDGRLSYDELGSFFRLFEPDCMEMELVHIFERMDTHQNGFVTEAELLAAVESCDPSFARGKSGTHNIDYVRVLPGNTLTNGLPEGGLSAAQRFDVAVHLQPHQMLLMTRWVESMLRQNVQPGQMFRALDKDHDGRLSYDELGSFFRLLEPSCMEMDLVQIFKTIDLDNDGFVTEGELQAAIELCNPTSCGLKSAWYAMVDRETQCLHMAHAYPTTYSSQVPLSPSKGAPWKPCVLEGLPPSRQDQVAGRERLNRLLFTHGVEEHKVLGDGNCQFRALAHQLFGSESPHGDVRRQVVSRLEIAAACYAEFVPDRFLHYVRGMARLGTWGDHVTLQAAADCFGVQIQVFTDYDNETVKFVRPAEMIRPEMILVTFHAEVHYNSTRRCGEARLAGMRRAKVFSHQQMPSNPVLSECGIIQRGGSRMRCVSAGRTR